MEQKADYAELRRLYFSPREQDKTPSHSNVSNFESKIEDEPLETPSSRLHEVITSTLDANEMFSSICQDEVNEFKTQLSQRSNDIINTLQDKYGTRTYSKITQMIKSEDFSEWDQLEQDEFKTQLSQRSNDIINTLQDKYGTRTYSKITQMIKSEDFSEWDQLEQELLSVQIDSLVDHELKESKLEQPNLASVAFDESFEELALAADADLDYLDALVQHDYGRLCRLQSDSESISSIFSEILENEQKSNSNYQDDIFNKNIELIFNSDVDLDDCEWEVIERAENKPLAANLDEAINSNYQDDIFNKNIELIFNSDVDLDDCEWEVIERAENKPLAANLDEAIDQLKQSSVLKEPTDKGLTIDHKQASLDAFYSEQKKEEIKSKDVFVSDENQGKINNRVQAKTFNKSILMVGIIVLAVIIYFILQ